MDVIFGSPLGPRSSSSPPYKSRNYLMSKFEGIDTDSDGEEAVGLDADLKGGKMENYFMRHSTCDDLFVPKMYFLRLLSHYKNKFCEIVKYWLSL